MTFLEYLKENNINIKRNNRAQSLRVYSNLPFGKRYCTNTLLNVTEEDFNRLKVMQDYLTENKKVDLKEFGYMLLDAPEGYLKTAKKYPYRDFVEDLRDHGTVYIANCISNKARYKESLKKLVKENKKLGE